jgi:hypothetical protein
MQKGENFTKEKSEKTMKIYFNDKNEKKFDLFYGFTIFP